MEAVRTAEGHQLAVRITRLRSNGNPFSLEETKAIGGSPSMPVEAPFGIVHLGEKFASNMIITNEGATSLQQVKVKIELQTSSQRSLLNETEEQSLDVGEPLNCQTLHDIREIGVHVIVCSVHYANPITHEKKFIRKFFKFTVINPLILKTKITELPESLLLEAQIQNVSGTTFVLESVLFEAIDFINCHTINLLLGNNDNNPIESRMDHLNLSPRSAEYLDKGDHLHSESMYQYVFVINLTTIPLAREVPLALGRLDIKWKSDNGERGRLQTGMLYHQWECQEAIKVLVKDAPSRILLHEPFEALFVLQNGTNRSLHNVRLIWDWPVGADAPAFSPLGLQEIHLGTLTDLNSTRTTMRLLPILAGLQRSKHFYVEYDDDGSLIRIPADFSILIETHQLTIVQ